jgi:hypothetical protein
MTFRHNNKPAVAKPFVLESGSGSADLQVSVGSGSGKQAFLISMGGHGFEAVHWIEAADLHELAKWINANVPAENVDA